MQARKELMERLLQQLADDRVSMWNRSPHDRAGPYPLAKAPPA